MHVLVTGAAGFIGSHVSEALAARGHRVTGFDSFEDHLYPATHKHQNAREIARHGVTVVEGDICDPKTITRVLDGSVDVVCHLAALAGVRPSLMHPQRYLQTNVIGTGVVVERMRTLGLTRLVFASSSSVYGVRHDDQPFQEDDPCLTPASPYAATKRMNELQLSTYRDLFGIGVFALRFFTVYGPRQRPDMAISKFVHAVAHEHRVTVFGDGTSRRDYTFISDIVDGVTAAIESVQPGAYELLNLGGTKTISILELLALVERIVGKRARVDHQPVQPGDVPITYANIDRARTMLGYKPNYSIETGISQYWEWLGSRL